MEQRIETLQEMKVVGKRVRMSFAQNQTKELWQSFMPERGRITNSIGTELYSIEVYDDASFFTSFNPTKEFEKWAAVQVANHAPVPPEMESLSLPKGLYAVFLYKGKSSEAQEAYQYIYATWLPASGYELDSRPHFAVMDERYKNNHPDSEEELWIPIKEQ